VSGNSIYISVGLTIIAALVAALVGPYFVPWDAYRPALQDAASRLIGAPVTISGSVSARLLPTPSLTAEEVVVGDLANPLLHTARFSLQIDVTPLLKGEVKVSELRLDRPSLYLVIDETGRLDLPTGPAVLRAGAAPAASAPSQLGAVPAAAAPDFAVERAVITGGVVDYVDMRSGARLRLDDLTAEASIASLGGPTRLEGEARVSGHPVALRLATGRRGDDGTWPVKAQVSSPTDQLQFGLDLAADLATGSPHATGSVLAQRLVSTGNGKSDRDDRAAPPWRFAARLDGRADLVQFADVEVSIGPDDRAVTLAGRGEVRLAAHPRYDFSLAARQIDLDRLSPGRAPAAAVPPPGAAPVPTTAAPDLAEAMRRALALVAGINRLDVDGRLALDVASTVVGGGIAQDLKAVLKPRVDHVAVDAFEIRLPGRSRVTARGQLATDGPDAGSFTGTGSIASEQPQVLAAWLRKDKAGGVLPTFTLDGRVTLGPTLARLDDATLSLGGATATGGLMIETPRDGAPRRLAARLAAETLDLDRIVALGSLFGVDGDGLAGNAALDLEVGTLTAGDLVAKGVVAHLARDGDRLTVDRLAVADADGTSIAASGTVDHIFTRPEGSLKATLRADRPEGAERLAARLFPGSDERVRRLAGRLAPLAADIVLDADAGPGVGTGTGTGAAATPGAPGNGAGSAVLTVTAKAAETELSAEIRARGAIDDWRAAAVTARATLTAPDAAALARQIGATPVAARPPRPFRLEARVDGPAARLAVKAEARLGEHGEARLGLDGTARPTDTALDGALKLDGTDLAAAAELVGLLPAWPQATPAPAPVAAALSARLTLGLDGARLADLAGTAGTTRVAGALSFAAPNRLTGKLGVGDLDAATVLEALVGRGTFSARKVRPDDVWPTNPLAGPIGAGLAADIAVTVDRLDYGAGRTLDKASFRFGLADGEARLDDVAASLAGGRLGGHLGVRRTRAGDLALEGTLALSAVRLSETPWRRDGRDVAAGTFDADLLFTAEGGSLAGLLAGSAGNGNITLGDAELKSLDPTVFAALADAIAAGTDLRDDRLRAFVQTRLDAGTLSHATVRGTLSLAAGTLRVRDAVAETRDVRATGTLTADLARWSLDGQITLASPPALAAANGTPARLAVQFRGAVDRPDRRFDLSQLETWVVTRTLDRETEKAEKARQEAEARRKRDDEARIRREEEARQKREDEARRQAVQTPAAVPPPQQAQPAPAQPQPTPPRPAAPLQPAAPLPAAVPAPPPSRPTVPAPPARAPSAAPVAAPAAAPPPTTPAPVHTVPAQPAVPQPASPPPVAVQPPAPIPPAAIPAGPVPPAAIPPVAVPPPPAATATRPGVVVPAAPIALPPMAPLQAVPDAPVIRSVTPEPPPGQPLILGPIGR
jgi:uncharacterized protein involved in outer membrane biogenesis